MTDVLGVEAEGKSGLYLVIYTGRLVTNVCFMGKYLGTQTHVIFLLHFQHLLISI